MTEIPDCPACGTWTCAHCGWKRHRANRKVRQVCGRCSDIIGDMVPTKHRRWVTYEDHAAEVGRLTSEDRVWLI